MLLFLLLGLLTAGFFIEFFQKHILRVKDPDIHELWVELENQEWFQELNDIPETKKWIELDKQNGLLNDTYYVRKIIDQGGHREGYIRYILDKTK